MQVDRRRLSAVVAPAFPTPGLSLLLGADHLDARVAVKDSDGVLTQRRDAQLGALDDELVGDALGVAIGCKAVPYGHCSDSPTLARASLSLSSIRAGESSLAARANS